MNFFNFKEVLVHAQEKLNAYQQALSDKEEVARERDMRKQQAQNLLYERDRAHEAVRMAQSEFWPWNQKIKISKRTWHEKRQGKPETDGYARVYSALRQLYPFSGISASARGRKENECP
ncbi:MAG: hypothetical protein ACLSAH_06245 [Bilophila wadsworthia]